MKRILALCMASVLMVSSSMVVFAEDGSKSVTAKDIEELKNEINSLQKEIDILTQVVKAKETNVTITNDPTFNNNPTFNNDAKNTNNNNPKLTTTNNNNPKIDIDINTGSSKNNGGGSGGGGGSSSGASTAIVMDSGSNCVSYNGCRCYPVKKIELNGVKSNATFMVASPDGGTMSSAKELAAGVGGNLLNAVATSAPGVNFATARVNFFVEGVTDNDCIAVYQLQNGKWVQLTVSEIRKDHVIVNMTQHGVLAFIRVPALAST